MNIFVDFREKRGVDLGYYNRWGAARSVGSKLLGMYSFNNRNLTQF